MGALAPFAKNIDTV
jgi:hypothetical protein